MIMVSGRSRCIPSSSSRYPFTEAQWEELEHQALIFKFMVSGLPIPPDLIFSIIGPTTIIPTQPHRSGWACFQLGLSTKIDPEPGRCRRTDGKKWRCSRQAFEDSKYCERHMHRGKSRPRKTLDSKPLQNPHQSSYSNLSSVTSDKHLCRTHHPVKDSSFMTFLGTEPAWSLSPPRNEKKQRVMYQFLEEKPQEKRDSWLKLVI